MQKKKDIACLCRLYLQEREYALKPSSCIKYRRMMENHIFPHLGSIPEQALTRQDLLGLVGILQSRPLAEQTIRDILRLLGAVWKDALEKGRTQNRLNFHALVTSARKPEIDVLHHWERKNLEGYLLRDADPCKYGVLLALYTGLRIGELCALRWGSIDLEKGTVTVCATMLRLPNPQPDSRQKTQVVCLPPKTRSSRRTIPLPGCLLGHLRRIDPKDKDAFFLTGTRERFVEPRTCEYRFKRYLHSSLVRDVNFHILRHTFATRCIEVGFDTKSLSEILGHANVTITMNLYVHPTLEYKRQNMNRLTLE